MEENKKNTGEKKSLGEICHAISKWLIGKYNFKTVGGEKIDDIFVYDGGIFKNEGRIIIKKEVEEMTKGNCSTHLVNEVINKIARMTFVDRNYLGNENINLICLENGVFDLRTSELKVHNPRYRFLSKLPVKYVRGAKCNKIENFIHEVLYEEDINVMQEWLGYLLWRSYFLKKGVILVGEGDTGKTTFLNMVVSFIGKKNISGVSLQKLSSDKFSAAHLYNKYVNVYDDLSASDISDVGAFKIATGGGYIQGEFKFGNQFQFMNFAKLMFATNKVPITKIKDDDMTYYKRWIVFRFDNVFDDRNKDTNRNLIEEITTDNEMSGLLNWALVGLRRVLRNKKFGYNKDIEDVKVLMQRNASDLAKFVQDCCIRGGEDDWMSKDELYGHYKEYCELNNLSLVSKVKFGRDVNGFGSFIIDSRKGQDTGWRFVKMIVVKPVFGV